MRKLLCAALFALAMNGAAPDPVHWTIEPVKSVKAGAKFTVKLAAKIETGWHLYSMKHQDEGPIATRIWIADGQPFRLAGKIQATDPQVLHDPSFNMEVEQYEGEAGFTLPVTAGTAGAQTLVVSASYQSCNNKMCLPPKTVKVETAVTVTQ
jgi:thiol:disulfide interchange protein DsbD